MNIKLASIYHYLFLILCFVIPFQKISSALPNIILIGLVVLFPFVVLKQHIKRLKTPEVFVYVALFLFLVINMLIFQDIGKEINIIKKIATPIIILLLYAPITNVTSIKKTLILSCFTAIVISTLRIALFYFSETSFSFSNGALVDELLIIDRLYLGFMCIISIVASVNLIEARVVKYRLLLVINISVSIFFILLASSRIAVLLLLLLFLLKILYAKKKVLYGFIFIGLMTVTASAFVVNKNLGERFFYTQSKESGKSYFELLKSWEARVVIWDCGVNILSSQTPILIGNGFYSTKDKLLECYKTTIDRKEKRDYFVNKGFNPHNTFLDFLLSYGIIAFSLFVILMGLFFKRVRFSYTQTALFVSLVCFSLIESYFQRQLGGYYFGFIFILLLFKEYLPKNK